jgi:hypothetical protein
MAKVSAASSAQNLGAMHPKTVINLSNDILFRHRLEETGPACSRIELRVRRKQRQAAAHTVVDPLSMVVEERPAKCRLGSLTTGNRVLFSSQLFPPFEVCFLDFWNNDRFGEYSVRVYQPDLYGRAWGRFLSLSHYREKTTASENAQDKTQQRTNFCVHKKLLRTTRNGMQQRRSIFPICSRQSHFVNWFGYQWLSKTALNVSSEAAFSAVCAIVCNRVLMIVGTL